MAHAINSNDLAIYKPKTGINTLSEYQDIWFVTVKGVNEWLEKRSLITYRWVHDSNEKTTMPSILVAKESGSENWRLKTNIERAPGYRWPLFQVLKAAHIAGEPCPTPRQVLEVWRKNTPAELQVMTDGVKYNISTGEQKEANLKAIKQCIQGLIG
jgi:hypothetical protein